MDKLECINLFCVVARLNSFTGAASELNVTQSAVSKKIAWLEYKLGFNLFERSARKIKLTDAGKSYLAFCVQLVEQINVTEQTLKGEQTKVSGKLKISAPSAFATQMLSQPVSEFLNLHPEVQLEVSVNDQQVDLYKDDVDIALRAAYLPDSGLKAKKLLDHELCYFAAPHYLEQNGYPSTPSDLAHHQCITYSLSRPSNVWFIDQQKHTVLEFIKSDSPEFIVQMALLGGGIAGMPKWMVQRKLNEGTLVELFADCEKANLPMYAVYKNADYIPFKIRAFVDFLSRYFTEQI
ncbi:LysR family transcriptional regulator [Pseudoalteromonas spongiae]|uniref:LysR family transcriptional regulator n=1 Tax=Pseudoalteromonas spongiae TaxID=298657 RepID=A0ABU8EWV8_9GAMM